MWAFLNLLPAGGRPPGRRLRCGSRYPSKTRAGCPPPDAVRPPGGAPGPRPGSGVPCAPPDCALQAARDIYIIADNLPAHKSKLATEWISNKRRIKIQFTPTYDSWLNRVGIWLNIFTKDVLRGGIWTSKEHLISQIMAYVKTYSATRTKPLAWTYTGSPLRI